MKVLIATDGSQHAEEAARMLSRFPHAERLELTVLSVIHRIEIHGSQEVIEWMNRNADMDRSRAAGLCRRIEDIFAGADATVDIVVAEGHPAQTIVAEAKQRASELIVVGALGRSMLDRLMVGSVSDYVATHAPCSVLAVRKSSEDRTDHPELKIAIAYDGSDPARFAVQDIKRFQWGSHTSAQVIHAIAFPFTYSEIPVDINMDALQADLQPMVDEMANKLQPLFGSVTSHVFVTSHVGDGIVLNAKENEVDLIVMGDSGHGLIGRFLMGSVSRHVLRHAGCSVWIARQPRT